MDPQLKDILDAYVASLKASLQGDEVPASVLKEAREFLKQNGIDSIGPRNPDVVSIADRLDEAAPRLPFDPDY